MPECPRQRNRRLGDLAGRDRSILVNIAASALIRGGSLLLTLVLMPAYIDYFGDQQVLGVWFTLASTITWLLNFDVGISNGLRNILVTALADPTPDRAREYISSTYLTTLAIVLVTSIAAFVVIPRLPLNDFFGVSVMHVSSTSLIQAVALVLVGILLQFVLRTIVAVAYAMQIAALPAFLTLATNVLLFLFLKTSPTWPPGEGLVVLSGVYAVAVNLPLFLASLTIYSTRLRGYSPTVRAFKFRRVHDVMSLGIVFFWLQIVFMLIANTDPFIVTWLTDPKHVVDYRIYYTPFNFIGSLLTLALTPIWSAVTDAVVHNDFAWVARLLRRLLRIGVVATFAIFAFVPFIQPFVDLWLGRNVLQTDWRYALAFAASASAFAWNGVVSSIANGLGRLRLQAVMLAVGVVIKASVICVGVSMSGDWLWIVVSSSAAMIPYLVVQTLDLQRLALQHGTE